MTILLAFCLLLRCFNSTRLGLRTAVTDLLEALNNDVPVIISKQSGVSEVLTHALKVDFWDVDEMANKIIAVLKYSPLKITLQNHGDFEVRKLKWKDSAAKCAKIYEQILAAL